VTLLVDLFGYLTVVIDGLTYAAQSMAIGGIVFLVLLARPIAWLLGADGKAVVRSTARLAGWSALALLLSQAASLVLNGAILIGTIDLSPLEIASANFAVADGVKMLTALLMTLLLLMAPRRAPAFLLLLLAIVEIGAATATTHAAARLTDRELLLPAGALHQLGAAIWIGGIPSFVLALARVNNGASWTEIIGRFSPICMVGAACIVLSGVAMSYFYVGSLGGFYGTAYGVMVSAKIVMLLALLALGFGNFVTGIRLRADSRTPVIRLRRFAEVEIGIGITIFFAAASLTSVPPAVDLTQDRVSWQEIVARNWPVWPRLASPDHDALALPALQKQLDAEAAAQAKAPPPAFVPGSGEIAPRNAADIAWSEYNHHWAGILVLAIGVLALLNQAGLRIARHWPLLFLVLAGFLFVRSDPEQWPLGQIPFFEGLRDVEVLQHRFFVALIVVFGLFEWWVRARGVKGWPALVFPLACAIGGAGLLTHQHAIANVREQLLIEITHTPLALAGAAAGWARWLELRLEPPASRRAGWVWPLAFVLVGLILLDYREA